MGGSRAAFAPRFAVSCSRELLEEVARLAIDHQLVVHTHASENRDEVALIKSRTGRRNIDYLADTGLTTPRLCLAHCVWVEDDEQSLMAERGVKVLHCPGSNLKLGSGLAPVVEMRRKGHLGIARRRRRGLQQPPRHVRGDAPGRGAAVGPSSSRRVDGTRRW